MISATGRFSVILAYVVTHFISLSQIHYYIKLIYPSISSSSILIIDVAEATISASVAITANLTLNCRFLLLGRLLFLLR